MEFHKSQIRADWAGGFKGQGRIHSKHLETNLSLPSELGGSGTNASPEDLLLASIASCYLATLGIVLDKARLKYQSLAIQAELRTELGPPPTIREIELIVKIVTDIDPEQLHRLAGRIDTFCVVSKALNPSLRKTVHLQIEKPTNYGLNNAADV